MYFPTRNKMVLSFHRLQFHSWLRPWKITPIRLVTCSWATGPLRLESWYLIWEYTMEQRQKNMTSEAYGMHEAPNTLHNYLHVCFELEGSRQTSRSSLMIQVLTELCIGHFSDVWWASCPEAVCIWNNKCSFYSISLSVGDFLVAKLDLTSGGLH